jgi:two-component system, response regulator PdtaR
MASAFETRRAEKAPQRTSARGAFFARGGAKAGAKHDMPRSLKVSIADDEAGVRRTLERMLRALGHTVVGTAENGLQLLEQCQQQLPELAIIDLEMPVLDGLAAAEDLREISPVPIILLSGHPDFQQVVRQREPIEVYLSKPVTLHTLQTAIDQALAQTAHG